MSSNNTASSPPENPNSDSTSSFFQEIFISFLALSCLFVVLCLVRWFIQRTTMRRATSLFGKHNTGGLDSAAVAALPTFPYGKHSDRSNESEENNSSPMECSICLSAVEEGEIVKLLPECMHSFHVDCIDMWLSGHTTCPVCRIEVRGSTSAAPRPNPVDMVAIQVVHLER